MIDKTVELELNLSDNLSRIEADPGQTQQLIMNLVINGAEAMGGAPGRVIITTSTIEIDEAFISHILTLDEITPGKYVCLEVQDTGCGMSEETKAKIFDPFFTTKFTGRGLGLAAVSGIVRGHRGALRVYSSPGEGTTFKVFLPAEDVHEVIEQPADTKDDTARGTVLLVDDEEVVRRIGHASLKRKGYEVLLAANGKEAIETLRSQPDQINLVILDMTMPVMGGEETLSHLRAIRPDILVIVCSGYNEVEVIRRFTRQGVASFLQKPYTAAALTRMVGNVLEGGSGKSTTAKS